MTWPDPAFVIPVTILRAPRTTDPYGSDVPDWDRATTQQTNAWVRPGPATGTVGETLVGRDEQELDARVWLAAGTPITGRDRVVVEGETFEVIGPPLRPRSPWADREHHVRADLRRVTGPGETP
jgi:hypothetical protein